MLNEGLAQRKEKLEELQKKINEVMLSVIVMIAYAVCTTETSFCSCKLLCLGYKLVQQSPHILYLSYQGNW